MLRRLAAPDAQDEVVVAVDDHSHGLGRPFPARTAVGRAHVRGGGEAPERATRHAAGEPLLDQLADHRDERRMRAGSAGPRHDQTELVADRACLVVEVVQHLEMVGDKSHRREHHRSNAARPECAQVVEHIRPEPWHLRRPASALIDDLVVDDPRGLGDQPRRLAQLRLVRAVLRHRLGDAVRGERNGHPVAQLGGKLGDRGAQRSTFASMKPGWLWKRRSFDTSGASSPERLLGVEDVLPILATAGVRAERRREERQRLSNAVVAHLPERVDEQRVPVAVAEVDRELDRVFGELLLDRRDQLAVLPVDPGSRPRTGRSAERPRRAARAGHRGRESRFFEEGQHVVGPPPGPRTTPRTSASN